MSRFEFKIFVTLISLYFLSSSLMLGIICMIIALTLWVGDIVVNILNAKRRKEGRSHLFSEGARKKIISDDSKLVQDMKFNKRKVYREDKLIMKKDEDLSDEIILEYRKELNSLECSIIEDVKRVDNNFNSILFLKLAHDIATELIKTKIIKYSSAKYLYQAFNKNVIEVKNPDFSSFEKGSNYYILKMKIEEKTVDHIVDSYEDDIIRINRDKSSISTYEMTFLKSLKTDGKVRNCPRCGAPLKEGTYGICEYCFKFIDNESSEKIESDVTKNSYDVPVIKLKEVNPHNCLNCGAVLKKELNGYCEYCKSHNNSNDNHWVLVEFKQIN